MPVTDQDQSVNAIKIEPAVEEPKPARKKPGPKPKAASQEVSLGRIVIYVTAAKTERPAIVTRVNEESVDLTVFNGQGSVPVREVREESVEELVPGTYHWPTR